MCLADSWALSYRKAVPRHGFTILFFVTAIAHWEVTSGNLSPLLQKGIGLGYVSTKYSTLEWTSVSTFEESGSGQGGEGGILYTSR